MSKKRVNIVESVSSKSVSSYESVSRSPNSPKKSSPSFKGSSTNFDILKGSSVNLDLITSINLKIKEKLRSKMSST